MVGYKSDHQQDYSLYRGKISSKCRGGTDALPNSDIEINTAFVDLYAGDTYFHLRMNSPICRDQ